ncbi:hypothetical protein EP7_000847 [Isosphaeraceae bacterium EP7]
MCPRGHMFVGLVPGNLKKVHRCPSFSGNILHVAAVSSLTFAAPRSNACRTPHRIGPERLILRAYCTESSSP